MTSHNPLTLVNGAAVADSRVPVAPRGSHQGCRKNDAKRLLNHCRDRLPNQAAIRFGRRMWGDCTRAVTRLSRTVRCLTAMASESGGSGRLKRHIYRGRVARPQGQAIAFGYDDRRNAAACASSRPALRIPDSRLWPYQGPYQACADRPFINGVR